MRINHAAIPARQCHVPRLRNLFFQHLCPECVKIAAVNRALKNLPNIKGDKLAQPNFQFEKRQKELAKKKKQEEKKQRKLAEKASKDQPEQPVDEGTPAV